MELHDFERLELIGRGGFGSVYRALQPMPRRTVALKILDRLDDVGSDHLASFRQECAALGAVSHPNVVQIYVGGVSDGIPWLALEFVDQGSIDTGLPVSVERALEMISDAARGLAAVHAAGIIHRDIKPSNLLVTSDGSVKVGDLGLAVLDEATGVSHTMTKRSDTGTFAYLAPELLAEASATVASDVYALGATLLELVSGKPPYLEQHLSLASLVKRIVDDEPPYVPSELPAGLRQLLMGALDSDPSVRPQSAGEFGAAVDQLLSELRSGPLDAHQRGLAAGKRAVLIVEGLGDVQSLTLATEVAQQTALLDDIEIQPLGGTANLQAAYVAHADAVRGGWKVLALFDSDEPGRKAHDELAKRCFDKKSELLQYADVFADVDAQPRQYPYEAEDLWDPGLVSAFGETNDADRTTFKNLHRHYDFNQEQKERFETYLRQNATAEHAARWITLLEMIRERLGLTGTAAAADSPVAEAIDDPGREVAAPGVVRGEDAETAIHEPLRQSHKIAPVAPDDYDDVDRWSFQELRALAVERGHRFRRGASRSTVIARLRRQDREGWTPGTSEHGSGAKADRVAGSWPTADLDTERQREELQQYLHSKMCGSCRSSGSLSHDSCRRVARLEELRMGDKGELVDYLLTRQCGSCRDAAVPSHSPCRRARHFAELAAGLT